MNRPIILHHIDPLSWFIAGGKPPIEPDQLAATHQIGIAIVDLSGAGIQRAEQPPLLLFSLLFVDLLPSPGNFLDLKTDFLVFSKRFRAASR